jgi:hypothetical protein
LAHALSLVAFLDIAMITALQTNIKAAGKNLWISSETLKCINTAPVINIAIIKAHGIINFL